MCRTIARRIIAAVTVRQHLKHTLVKPGRQLPPEVIANIIDYLHDSPSDLRACALVCRSWVAPSRFHLFQRISVCRYVYTRCRILHRTIERSPYVALYIREFCFSANSRWVNAFILSRLKKRLPLLLRSLTRLRKLKIINVRLGSSVFAFFYKVLALPSLVHFEMEDVSFHVDEFKNLFYPHLKQLVVHNVRLIGLGTAMEPQVFHEIDDEQVGDEQLCRLESLALSKMDGDFIDWVLSDFSPIDVSHIRNLCTAGSCASLLNEEMMSMFMERLDLSLEHLTIRLHSDFSGTHPLSLFSFPFPKRTLKPSHT
jgi:hypothetical protein